MLSQVSSVSTRHVEGPGVFIAEEVNEAGDRVPGDTTTVTVLTLFRGLTGYYEGKNL
jgi:hypothetical protein